MQPDEKVVSRDITELYLVMGWRLSQMLLDNEELMVFILEILQAIAGSGPGPVAMLAPPFELHCVHPEQRTNRPEH